jgi:DNA repair exonuclease SbcCD ATPase subunit
MKNEVSYSDWVVDREELKPVKRRNNCNDLENRMYSIFKCKYCNLDFDIATDFLRNHKKRTIDNHLSTCKSYTGDRPAKRNKVSNTQQSSRIEQLEMEMSNLRENHKTLNESHEALTKDQEEMKGILTQHQIYWGCVATAFGYTPPQDPPFLIDKIRELKQQEPMLLEYKEICHENKKIIELKNEEIQQRDKSLEQTALELAESKKRETEMQQKMDEITQELKKTKAQTERLKKAYEKKKLECSEYEYNKKQEDDEFKRKYGMQEFLRKQAIDTLKPGCLYKPS